jgi:hypothetical protein
VYEYFCGNLNAKIAWSITILNLENLDI